MLLLLQGYGAVTPVNPDTRGRAGGYTLALSQGGINDYLLSGGGIGDNPLTSGGSSDAARSSGGIGDNPLSSGGTNDE
jgi:hypothetical protein